MRYLLFLIVLSLAMGCGNRSLSDYEPAETSARETLVAGLTAWQEGKPAGTLPSVAKGQPTVQFADFQWTANKKLKTFKVLEEAPTLEGSTHKFRAHLEIEGESPQDVDYYIVGIDPLWIMRDRDYQQSSMQ
jgi:hypothetical protein